MKVQHVTIVLPFRRTLPISHSPRNTSPRHCKALRLSGQSLTAPPNRGRSRDDGFHSQVPPHLELVRSSNSTAVQLLFAAAVIVAVLLVSPPGFSQTRLSDISINSVLDANSFPGQDIFARANAAAASLQGKPGVVAIRPGNYFGVTTSLKCLSDVEFTLAGVAITYTGSGNAISCQSVSRAKIAGPLHLFGLCLSGTVGLYVGNPNSDSGLTTEDEFSDITIGGTPAIGVTGGFDVGIRVDGQVNSGTYYNKFDRVSSNGNLNQGWLILASAPQRANSNRCIACTAVGNGDDGFRVDGVNSWTFIGIDAERNRAYNFDLPGSMNTSQIVVLGGDFEGAGLADFHFGSSRISHNSFIGMNVISPSTFAGSPERGQSNLWWPGNSYSELMLANGSRLDLPVGRASASGASLRVRDTENSNASLFQIARTGLGTGLIALGTDQYPLTIHSDVTMTRDAVVNGNLTVKGTINKGADHFMIDDPLDPQNKYLFHSVVESPDMKDIYDGIAILDQKGEATVRLPPWFQALNGDFRYQLTCIGSSAPVYVAAEVQNNRFRIAGGKPGLKVSWQLTGIRHDAFAKANPVVVEQSKSARERGSASEVGSAPQADKIRTQLH